MTDKTVDFLSMQLEGFEYKNGGHEQWEHLSELWKMIENARDSWTDTPLDIRITDRERRRLEFAVLLAGKEVQRQWESRQAFRA